MYLRSSIFPSANVLARSAIDRASSWARPAAPEKWPMMRDMVGLKGFRWPGIYDSRVCVYGVCVCVYVCVCICMCVYVS